jgi:hypothetical protein
VTDRWTHKKFDDYLSAPWTDEELGDLVRCEDCDDYCDPDDLHDGVCRKCETKLLDLSDIFDDLDC